MTSYIDADDPSQGAPSKYRKHRGIIAATSMRVVGPVLFPRDGAGAGQGMELVHVTDNYSAIQVYNREKSQWLDLQINARSIGLNPQGGKIYLPQGSAQALIGQYRAIAGWNVPALAQWYESTAQVNVTCQAGSVIRLEACGTALMDTPATGGAVLYFGFMRDGVLLFDSLQAVQVSNANAISGFSFMAYDSSPLAGLHRYAITCYLSAGAGGLWSGAYTNLWVTEQRA
jgi:hypothetical protein